MNYSCCIEMLFTEYPFAERIYRAKAEKRLGLRTQLSYGKKEQAAEDESDFRV